VTSDTGLTNFSTSQHHIARITPSAVVYGRAGCITFHYLQFGRSLDIPFTITNTSSVIFVLYDVSGRTVLTALYIKRCRKFMEKKISH
jgi:hypothetical protein